MMAGGTACGGAGDVVGYACSRHGRFGRGIDHCGGAGVGGFGGGCDGQGGAVRGAGGGSSEGSWRRRFKVEFRLGTFPGSGGCCG